jgi:hypothetical protein
LQEITTGTNATLIKDANDRAVSCRITSATHPGKRASTCETVFDHAGALARSDGLDGLSIGSRATAAGISQSGAFGASPRAKSSRWPGSTQADNMDGKVGIHHHASPAWRALRGRCAGDRPLVQGRPVDPGAGHRSCRRRGITVVHAPQLTCALAVDPH